MDIGVSGGMVGIAFIGAFSCTIDGVEQAAIKSNKQIKKVDFCMVVVLLINCICTIYSVLREGILFIYTEFSMTDGK